MADRRSLVRLPRGGFLFAALALTLTLAVTTTATSARAATVTGFSPLAGPPGTEVVVSGTSLQTATVVYFGSTEAPGEILARGATSVRTRVPPNALTGQISVFTSGAGVGTSAQIFVAAPRIEAFTPASGGPGTTVTIDGANFGTGLGGGRGNLSKVMFGTATAAFQVVGINQLLAVVPTNATTGPITLVNEAGSVAGFTSFQVNAVVTGFNPPKAMPGDEITVRGRNLETTVRVEIGLVQAPFLATSPTNLVVRIPTNAVNGRLQVTTLAGPTAPSSNVVVLPRIIQFTPAFGAGGTNVLLQGGGFNGVTAVQFNGLNAPFNYRSSTEVATAVPNGASSGPIKIITTNGTFTTTVDFAFPARITDLNPNAAQRGDTITVDGSDLGNVTTLRFAGVEVPFTKVSNNRLTFVVPAAATTGRVAVQSPSGEALSPGTVTIRAVLDGFSPDHGPVGSAVILSGAGITNVGWVRLGGLDTSFTLLNPTSIRALVPVGAYSGTFRIRAAEGQELETTANFFVDGAQPKLTGFTPTNGVSGTKVTLTGAGLRTLSRVQFNGVDATFTVKSPTQVETTVPNGATTGTIAATTLDGIAITTAPFVIADISVALRADVGPGTFVLRWPQSAPGFVLESSLRLGPDALWQTVAQPPVADGADWRVTLVLPQTGNRFYRLRK